MSRLRSLLLLALAATPLASVAAVDVLQAAPARPRDTTAVQPERVLDTRSGVGMRSAAMVVPGQTLAVAVPAAASANATSVVLNLTATDATRDGWVKAWPCGEPMPATSSLNFTASGAVANAAMLKLPAAGVCLATSAPVNLVADVTGWYTGTEDFNGSTPNRLLDTRISGDPLEPGVERRLKVAGTPGIAANASMTALNLTVDRPAAAGWVVAYPCGQPTNSSTVNFQAGEIVANLTLVGLTAGDVCLRSLGRVELIIDTYGWSAGAGKLKVVAPSRLLDTRETARWPSGKAASASTIELHVADRGGVPADADAALITVTVTGTSSNGFVTVWPCDRPFPVASTINTWPNALRSNLAFVKLSASQGTACLQYRASSSTPTEIVVDVVGWTAGGPARTVAAGIGTVAPSSAPAPTTPTTPTTPTPAAPAPTGSQFAEGFATAAGLSRLDFQAHTSSEGVSATFLGEHNTGCGGPDTHRTVHGGHRGSGIDMSASELIWWCAPTGDPASGHFMTALDTVGVATLSFSPKQTFTNVRKVCWEQNMNNLGEAKWLNMFVVPAADVAAHGGNLNYAAGSGLPFGGFAQLLPPGAFDFTWLRGSFLANNIGSGGNYSRIIDVWGSYPANMEVSPGPRHQICVEDLETGNIRYSVFQTGTGAIQTYTGPGSLPNGQVKVILQDASYNPTKHDGSVDHLTWHWDNITVS